MNPTPFSDAAVHGEPKGLEALAVTIRSELGGTAAVAEDQAKVPLVVAHVGAA